MITPATVTQWDKNYSNIEGTMVSYSHLMLVHDKTGQWLPKEKQWRNMGVPERQMVIANMSTVHSTKVSTTEIMKLHGKGVVKNVKMPMLVSKQ
jgi:hypothetical protein